MGGVWRGALPDFLVLLWPAQIFSQVYTSHWFSDSKRPCGFEECIVDWYRVCNVRLRKRDHIYEEENEESSIGQPQVKTSKTAEHQDQLQKNPTKLALTTSGR